MNMNEKTFEVRLTQVSYNTAYVEIQACCGEEAEKIALHLAQIGSINWEHGGSDSAVVNDIQMLEESEGE
ncbi:MULTISPECIES: hypothetical protein [Burkholderiaceae]|uniref:hypothetical protein n=1 Tax=Burkholderiaceae TaxID=119060 RepID=UPI001178BED2|nr:MULTISPECIES: hypothetical protein [Burkholderiaceae]MBY4717493.1 hypothetical protein [Ralstonia mannitolilytica]MCW5156440.1 hypothetical protein [Burkholderia cenocepacia]MDN8015405.1 hypothetical protein [Burkholderia multivorans]